MDYKPEWWGREIDTINFAYFMWGVEPATLQTLQKYLLNEQIIEIRNFKKCCLFRKWIMCALTIRVEYILTNVNLICFCLVATRTRYFCLYLWRAESLSMTLQSFRRTKHALHADPCTRSYGDRGHQRKLRPGLSLQGAYSPADYTQASLWIRQAPLAMTPASKQVYIKRKLCKRGNTHIFVCWVK